MTIGRTDDPENPFGATAIKSRFRVWGWIADPIWASGHRCRVNQAEHMIAIDPPVRILTFPLASEGPFSNRVSLVKPKISAFQPSFHCQSLRDETSLVLRPPRLVVTRRRTSSRGLGRNGPSLASKQASLRSAEVKPRSREAGRRRRRA